MTQQDYSKLADLLYPDSKDITFYLNQYRDRQTAGEVTRLAPSPTGYLHVGQVYQALIHKMLSRSTNGVYYMRLEDTDNKRELKDAGNIAYSWLKKFNLDAEEGYQGNNEPIGEYGPYIQSKRLEIYHAFAHELVKRGRAFPCFCEAKAGKDEILKARQRELDATDDIEERDPCRDLSLDDIISKLNDKKPFALRLMSNGSNRTFNFKDEIKGKREIRENMKDDVLIKSNGIPVYAFAHIVDDTLMKTTVIVRGQEWYQSLPVHLELSDAFGLPRFRYAHTPNIFKLGENGNPRKISKRLDPEAKAEYYLEQGYPVNAVLEYLLNLINSDFEMWRKNNPTTSLFDFPFELRKIGSNNPLFDFAKLNDISKTIISRMTAQEVYDNAITWAQEYNTHDLKVLTDNKQLFLDALSIDRGGDRPRKDIVMYSDIVQLYNYILPNFAPQFDIELGNVDKVQLVAFLSDYTDNYSELSDNKAWFDDVKDISSKYNFVDNKTYKQNPAAYAGSISDVSKYIRLAITGRENSPELYSIMKLLGVTECQSRLNALITRLK